VAVLLFASKSPGNVIDLDHTLFTRASVERLRPETSMTATRQAPRTNSLD